MRCPVEEVHALIAMQIRTFCREFVYQPIGPSATDEEIVNVALKRFLLVVPEFEPYISMV